VVGTATAVHGAVQGHQQNQAQAQADEDQQQAAPPAAPPAAAPAAPVPASPPSTDDLLAQLKALGQLKADGVLTDAEFEAQKARLLGS
jgi:pyruvate/2-oxoglutarate dehydrogenase complex dihydrolipoamide acyltransferase (E2) component